MTELGNNNPLSAIYFSHRWSARIKFKKVYTSAQKPKGRHLSSPHQLFWGSSSHFGFCRWCSTAGSVREPPAPLGWYCLTPPPLQSLITLVAPCGTLLTCGPDPPGAFNGDIFPNFQSKIKINLIRPCPYYLQGARSLRSQTFSLHLKILLTDRQKTDTLAF